jgi:phosphatidylglycerophosphate synthase
MNEVKVVVSYARLQARGPAWHSLRAQTANLLSLSRFLFAAAWIEVFFGAHQRPEILGAIALSAAVSDFLDGRIARWTNSVAGFGRWLDSCADIAFVLGALSCEAYTGVIPYYVPALIAASFAQYALDSVLTGGSAGLIRSRLGHWGGILNYIMVIMLPVTPARLSRTIVCRAAPLIALFYLAAMFERALSYHLVWRGYRAILTHAPVSKT